MNKTLIVVAALTLALAATAQAEPNVYLCTACGMSASGDKGCTTPIAIVTNGTITKAVDFAEAKFFAEWDLARGAVGCTDVTDDVRKEETDL